MNPYSPLGYALAGVSRFAEFCLRQYIDMPEIRPVAVWNRSPDKAAALAEKYGLRQHYSLESLAADPNVDIVHIATIPSLHAAQSLTVLSAGKHVLCEKPLATKAEDARHVLAMAKRNGLRLSTNFVMRYSPLWDPLKSVVQEKLAGALLRAEVINCAGDSGLPAGHWFWDESLSGGIFVEHGVHFFDLITSWMDGAGKVSAAETIHRPGSPVVDQAMCQVRYGSQASAGFYHGFHQPDVLDRQQIRLVFERGEFLLKGWIPAGCHLRAAVDSAARERLEMLLPGAAEATSTQGPGIVLRRGTEERIDAVMDFEYADPRDGQTLYGQAIKDLMRDFVQNIRDPSRMPRVTAEHGMAALELAVEARRLSSRNNVS